MVNVVKIIDLLLYNAALCCDWHIWRKGVRNAIVADVGFRTRFIHVSIPANHSGDGREVGTLFDSESEPKRLSDALKAMEAWLEGRIHLLD